MLRRDRQETEPRLAGCTGVNRAKLSLSVPVHNERDTVRVLLARLRTMSFEPVENQVVVIEDFCIPGTWEMLAEAAPVDAADLRVICYARNQGKGAVIRTGPAHAPATAWSSTTRT